MPGENEGGRVWQGRTVLFVSHNTAAIAQLCTRGLLLEKGTQRCLGSVQECLALYADSANSETGRMVSQVQIIDPQLEVERIDIQGHEGAQPACSVRHP